MSEKTATSTSSSINKKMNKIANKLEKMDTRYDSIGFVNQLDNWVNELYFFYNTLVPKQAGKEGENISKTFYKIPPAQRPSEGQVAYFNLRRGYPKEVFDGHYCYIVKDFGTKYLVVPTTSVKDGSSPNPKYEYDIEIDDFINNSTTRLQISDIRSVDVQRINEKKGVYNVKTDRQTIVDVIKNISFS